MVKKSPRPKARPKTPKESKPSAPEKSIRPKTREQVRVEDEMRQFGNLEFRADMEDQLSWNPLARLGFEPDQSVVGRPAYNSPDIYEGIRYDYDAEQEYIDETLPRAASGAEYRDIVGRVKPGSVVVNSNTAKNPVWSHEYTHGGLEKVMEYLAEDRDFFTAKYGEDTVRLLDEIRSDTNRSKGPNEKLTEMLDDVSKDLEVDLEGNLIPAAGTALGKMDNTRTAVEDWAASPTSSSWRSRRTLQEYLKLGRVKDEKLHKSDIESAFPGYVGIFEAAEDMLEAQGEPLPTEKRGWLKRTLSKMGFNQGGKVMNNQTEMAFMKQGGIKDDGMKKDPVSGNEIPPGSMAKEVRDDIPAMLSEGEYVVPADVLRFYGVNFFEDLRNKAKSGLQGMEQNGRIGGEPLSPQQIQQNMGQAPAPVQANQGGMMQGFNQAGLTAPSSTFDPSAFAVVGGSTFKNQGQQAQQDSVTTFKTFVNSVDGSTQIVEFVDGKLKNPAMEKFTQPPYYEQGSSALKQAQAQSKSSNDDKPDFPDPVKGEDPKDWGLDVDWSDPMAYANSVIEGQMGRGTRSVLQGLSALAGPIGVAAVGAGLGIQALSQVSNLRAAAEIARAQGMDEQAKSIDGMIKDFMAEQPAIVDFFDDLRGESNKNALTVMDRMGMRYKLEDGKITYTPEMIKNNTRALQVRNQTAQEKAADEEIVMSQSVSNNNDDDPFKDLKSFTGSKAQGESDMEKIIDKQVSDYAASGKEFDANDPSTWAANNKGGLMAPKKKKK